MESLILNISAILTEPPGNLIYHLALAIAILAAWQAALSRPVLNNDPSRKRFLLAFSMILAGQMALFVLSGLSWQNMVSVRALLPLLDRGLFVFNLAWIIWLWGFNQPARSSDLVSEIFNLGVIAILGFTFYAATHAADVPINGSWMDTAWQVTSILVCTGGILLLLINHPGGWGTGLVFLSINLLGSLAHLLVSPGSGDFSMFTRLAQICSYPLLSGWAIHHLSGTGRLAERPAVNKEARVQTPAGPEPGLVQAWLQTAAQTDPSRLAPVLARAVAQTLSADVCYVTTISNLPDQLHFRGGYQGPGDLELKTGMLPLENIPTLAGDILQGRPVRQNNGAAADLAALAAAIGIERTGSLLYMPLPEAAGSAAGGLLLLAPFSNRTWTEKDQAFLAALTGDISRMISRFYRDADTALKTVPQTRIQAAEQERLLKQNQALRAELERVRNAMKTMATRDAMTALQNESRETILSLQEEIEELRIAKENNGANPGRLSGTMQAGAEIYNQGGVGEKQVQLVPDSQAVNLTAMDLRQPVTTVMGYTELLLSESVGILGSIQKKYLERIRNATVRISNLVDHLVEINVQPVGRTGQSGSQAVDFASVINQAVAKDRQQISEKKIKLRFDLPEVLPVPLTDQGMLDRVIDGLLQNAAAVTPVEGTIWLTARNEVGTDSTPFLLIQLTNSDGGISADDLSRLFLQQTSGAEPANNGISDKTGSLVSLKSLVESQAGRIWVESQAGLTTSFSVLLPVQADERAGES